MTIFYLDPILPFGKDYVLPFSYLRLFHYWYGSLFQRLLFESFVWFALAAVVIATKVYIGAWPVRVLSPFASVANLVSAVLTLVLGFFTTIIYTRWWDARLTMCGNMQGGGYDLALEMTQFVYDDNDPAVAHRLMQRLLRWVNLSFALVVKEVIPSKHHLYSTYESIVKVGLATEEERNRLERDVDRVRFTLPIMWAGHLLTRLRDQNYRFGITDRVHIQCCQMLAVVREGLGGMLLLKYVPMPLMYRQYVSAAVRTYLVSLVVLAGDLNLLGVTNYSELGGNRWLDMVYIVVVFFVYVGWLHVADELANPYRIAPDSYDYDDCLSGQRCDLMTMADQSRLRVYRVDKIYETPLPGDPDWYLPFMRRDHRHEPFPFLHDFIYSRRRGERDPLQRPNAECLKWYGTTAVERDRMTTSGGDGVLETKKASDSQPSSNDTGEDLIDGDRSNDVEKH